MLVAKINPPAKRFLQDTPFSVKEFIGDHMIVKCVTLIIGASSQSQNDKIEFSVKFGTIKYEPNLDGTPGNPIFDSIYHTSLKFSASEFANWGTDDSYVFTIIAQKFNFQIVETFELDVPFN